MIPYGRQDINEQDIQAVVDVLRSNWLTQGPAVPQFEGSVARYCDVGNAVAMSNATAALHVACMALGVGRGDRLWTSPNTFVASANCGLLCGAEVDFVDIDPRTYNLDTEALREKLQLAQRTGRLPKVLIPVHFAGQSCDMRTISSLSKEYGFHVIEDASHAIGAKYLTQPVGACLYSDVTVFSFHPVKVITSGEGGMALTQSADLADRMQLLRSHGITRDDGKMIGDSHGDWYYQQIALGLNYRMTDLQAALGASQMDRLDEFVRRRHAIAERYDAELAPLGVIVPWRHPDNYSALHLYPIRVTGRGSEKRAIFAKLRAKGIGVNVHYIPVHLQPYYRQMGFKDGDFPAAELYYSETISLPMFPALTDEEQGIVIREVAEALQ